MFDYANRDPVALFRWKARPLLGERHRARWTVTSRNEDADQTTTAEAPLQALLDAAPDAMVVVDGSGTVVMANSQCEALFGYERNALLGERVEVLVPERLLDVHPAHRTRYFAEPRTRPMGVGLDLAARRSDGTEFPAEISLSSIQTDRGIVALAAIRDLSARKSAEATFQAMLDAAPDAMVGVSRDGVIVMANSQTETVFGYSRGELIGERLEMLIPDRAKEVHPQHRDSYFHEPRVRPMGVGLDLAGLRSDATEFPAEISLSWIETPEGIVALGAIRDITERKEQENETRRARAQAEHATAELQEAYRELQSFSYAVAHDLRAPLRAIDGFSQALLEDHGATLEEGGQAYLERVRRNVQRMSGMIDALLELSRLVRSTFEAQDVDLSALVEETLATLREEDPNRIVTTVVQPGISARGDSGLLRILVTNLLSNAWKFTAPRPGARIEFGMSDANGDREFFVRDEGVGFDVRYADKLFTPFQRLHAPEDFGGSGIGLATAERIVRRHGGRIRAEGAVDRGATFSFTLGDENR